MRFPKIKVGKAETLCDRPVNKLLTLEVNSEHASTDAVSDNDNIGKTKSRPNSEAALKSEIKLIYCGTINSFVLRRESVKNV